MKWLVIIDPEEGLNPETDTSLAIIREARDRQIEVDTLTIDKLYFRDRLMGVVRDKVGFTRKCALDDYDLIFLRKEPPYDMSFHYATQLLSLAQTQIINSPAAIRNLNEKLIALSFKEFMPPTLVSSDICLIEEFLSEHKVGVIKGLDSFQGISVTKVLSGEKEKIRSYTGCGLRPVMVQKFLPEVMTGDKRILVLGDKVVGSVLRRPLQGYHANFANSEAILTPPSKKEQAALDRIIPWLLEQGIHFSGLDFIGEQLTEINITCPTGVIQLGRLTNRNITAEVVDYFEMMSK